MQCRHTPSSQSLCPLGLSAREECRKKGVTQNLQWEPSWAAGTPTFLPVSSEQPPATRLVLSLFTSAASADVSADLVTERPLP